MIGIGPAHADNRVDAYLQGMIQRVFKLTPFVAGNDRVQQIISLYPEFNTVPGKFRIVNAL